MGESLGRWESDPLFSAAEVVQDSADRMESVFKMLMHDESVSKGATSDSRALSLMKYHRRDLATSLETTKWQLEDFERAVNLAALSESSISREYSIAQHRQFIRAIREQIRHVERSLEDSSMAEINNTVQPGNFNERDAKGLALFLSGGGTEYHMNYDPKSSISEEDEIVELKGEEAEPFLNGMERLGYGYDISNKYGSLDLEAGTSSSAWCSHTSTLKGRLWRFLRSSWFFSNRKGDYTKRRKDGEVTDEFAAEMGEKMHSSNSTSTEQDQPGITRLADVINATWAFQRSRSLILYSHRLKSIAAGILFILILLCLFVLRRA